MLSGKLTLNHDSVKNEKLRQIAWITNTIEDKDKLEEMFWPTMQESRRNDRLNSRAKKYFKK